METVTAVTPEELILDMKNKAEVPIARMKLANDAIYIGREIEASGDKEIAQQFFTLAAEIRQMGIVKPPTPRSHQHFAGGK